MAAILVAVRERHRCYDLTVQCLQDDPCSGCRAAACGGPSHPRPFDLGSPSGEQKAGSRKGDRVELVTTMTAKTT